MKNINKMNSPYFFKKNKKDRIQRQPFSGSNQNKIFYLKNILLFLLLAQFYII